MISVFWVPCVLDAQRHEVRRENQRLDDSWCRQRPFRNKKVVQRLVDLPLFRRGEALVVTKIHAQVAAAGLERHDEFRTGPVGKKRGRARELLVEVDRVVHGALGILRAKLAPRTVEAGDVVRETVAKFDQLVARASIVVARGRCDEAFDAKERR